MCAILLILKCSFLWHHFWPKSYFSVSGQKPWAIVHGLTFVSSKKVWRKVCHAKENEKTSLMVVVSGAEHL